MLPLRSPLRCAITLACSIAAVTIPVTAGTAWSAGHPAPAASADSVKWRTVPTDSGVVHAAIAMPPGKGPFPAVVILHGTHGFAEEYVRLARRFADAGVVGVAACWFAGGRGVGTRFITPIACDDAPPLVDVPGLERFRIARQTIDVLVREVKAMPGVDSGRVALFGHSRGAGASLDYAQTHPGQVRAVILESAGYPPEAIRRVATLDAAVLVLHGTDNDAADGGTAFTAVDAVRRFEAALRAAKKDVEAKYYEGSGHNGIFTSARRFDDTVQRTTRFLERRQSR